MLCHHVFCYPPAFIDVHFSWLTLQIGEIGKVCVSMFLFVSGYGLYKQYNSLISKVLPPPIAISQNDDNEEVSRGGNRWSRLVLLIKETFKFELKRFIKFYTNYWVIFLIFVPTGALIFNRTLTETYGADNVLSSLTIDILGFKGLESYNTTWWFNRLILTLYLAFPLLYYAVKRCGWFVLLIAMVWMKYNHIQHLEYLHLWLFVFALGMCAVRYQRHLEFFFKKVGKNWSLTLAIFFTLFWIAECQFAIIPYSGPYLTGIRADGFITFGVFLIVCFLQTPPRLSKIFECIGQHSSNMYMTHTFVYCYWFPTFVYATNNAFFPFATLFLICIGVSWFLEFLKDKTGIYKLSDKCILSDR